MAIDEMNVADAYVWCVSGGFLDVANQVDIERIDGKALMNFTGEDYRKLMGIKLSYSSDKSENKFFEQLGVLKKISFDKSKVADLPIKSINDKQSKLDANLEVNLKVLKLKSTSVTPTTDPVPISTVSNSTILATGTTITSVISGNPIGQAEKTVPTNSVNNVASNPDSFTSSVETRIDPIEKLLITMGGKLSRLIGYNRMAVYVVQERIDSKQLSKLDANFFIARGCFGERMGPELLPFMNDFEKLMEKGCGWTTTLPPKSQRLRYSKDSGLPPPLPKDSSSTTSAMTSAIVNC